MASKRRLQPIWVDRAHTVTAGDLDTVADCQECRRVITRDITLMLSKLQHIEGVPRDFNELMGQRELSFSIPRNTRQALFLKKRGVLELTARIHHLTARQ